MKIILSTVVNLISVPFLLANAEKVTFKVLAVKGTPSLNISGKQYSMKAVENMYPLYETSIDTSDFPINYNYILDYPDGTSVQEEFSRQRLKNEASLNEYFGRSVTIKEHPLLPKAFEEFPYTSHSNLFNDNYVATIIVNCDPNDLKKLYSDTASKENINAEVIYASPYHIRTFKSAKLALSGESTRDTSKLSYKLKNLKDEDKKDLFNRSSIKLRAEHMDPTFLRDKIYGDIANTLGVPTAQNTFARLFINGEEIGFFDLSDKITSKHYIRETFNNGNKFTTDVYPLFKGIRFTEQKLLSDLSYHGDDASQVAYEVYQYKGEDKDDTNSTVTKEHISQDLIPLLKEIEDYRKGNVNDLSLDIDTFLKSMALEFLAGAVDNFWNLSGNFYIFRSPVDNTWWFHDCDFHYTFGCNWAADLMLNTPLADFPPIMEDGDVGKKRALVDAIRSRPENEERLRQILTRLLLTSFHPNALFPRIESLVTLIREDVHRDISLPKVKPDAINADEYIFTLNNFEVDSTSEQGENDFGGFPIRYFIKVKARLLANELGIEVPSEYLSDLGYFNLIQSVTNTEKAAVASGAVNIVPFSILSLIFAIIINKILF